MRRACYVLALIAALQAEGITQSPPSPAVFYNAGALPEAMTGGDLDGDPPESRPAFAPS